MFTHDAAKLYGQIVGATVVLLGVGGLVAGEGPLLAVFNIELVEDLVHIGSGLVLAYAGFVAKDAGVVRSIVGAVGVIYLLIGVIGFLAPMLFGLLPEYGYSVADNILHLFLGALALAAARVSASSTQRA